MFGTEYWKLRIEEGAYFKVLSNVPKLWGCNHMEQPGARPHGALVNDTKINAGRNRVLFIIL